jgi:hypothetical protein
MSPTSAPPAKDAETMNHRTSTPSWPSGGAARIVRTALPLHPARRAFAAALLAAAAGVAAAAGPPLPQRNLAVEARVVESSALERQTIAGGGTVVIGTSGTGGSTLSAGTGGVRVGTDSQRSDSVQRVLVLNGGRATLRLSQWLPLRTAEWVWAGNGRGVGSSTVWVDIGQGLSVRPSWPGGNQPVRAEIAIESTARNDTRGSTLPDASAPRLSISTELSMPLGEWVSVGQVFDDSSGAAAGIGAGAGGAGVVSSTRSLRRELSVQLRVTLP